MKNLVLTTITLFIFISGCRNTTEPSVKPPPFQEMLSSFKVVHVDYDSVKFVSTNDIIFDNKLIEEIVVSKVIDGDLVELKKITPVYIKTGNQYRLEFEITIGPERDQNGFAINRKPVDNFLLTFYLEEGETVNIDKRVEYYKYPYKNALIHFTAEDLPNYDINGNFIYRWWRDFDISNDGENFIFCQSYRFISYNNLYNTAIFIDTWDEPFVSKGIGKQRLHRQPKSWDNYYLAVDGQKLYYDYGIGVIQVDYDKNMQYDLIDHDEIFRSINSTIDDTYYSVIQGLEATNDFIYLTTATWNSPGADPEYNWHFFVSDNSGNIIQTHDWEASSILESSNNIFYSYAYKTDEIIRYDLNTNTFLDRISAPSKSCWHGFEITNDRFYYSDWDAILSIPLEDLIN